MSNEDSIVELFKTCFENNAGIVHEVETLDSLSGVVSNILLQENISKAILGSMPTKYSNIIVSTLDSLGIELLKPPEGCGKEIAGIINLADVGITFAEFGVADIGAIAEITQDDKDRLISSLPRIHIALLRRGKIVKAFEETAKIIRQIIQEKDRCVISFIGGPSRTGDIELKLVLGVHGPHKVHTILLGE